MALKVAVIGVGYLGRHHARLFASMPGVELVGIADTNLARADEIAAQYGTRAFGDAAALIALVDAVTIAVPTEQHAAVALAVLGAGKPVLVEKPIARSLAEARSIVDAGMRAGVPVAVGHTERFNPAVSAARARLRDPRFIEVHRLGTFPERSLDIDVVFDLMIHDLDILLSVVDAPVESIDAVGVPVLTGRVDIANARIRFANGCIANVTASRISRDRVRKIRFFEQRAYLSIDYTAQKLEVWRLVAGDGQKPAIEGGEVEVATEEPLRRELADFVSAVAERRAPLVAGEDGCRALALAQRINDAIAGGLAASVHHGPWPA